MSDACRCVLANLTVLPVVVILHCWQSPAQGTNGFVTGWGDPGSGCLYTPLDTNYAAVAAGEWIAMALKNDGTVTGWGWSWSPPPAGLSNVIAISGGAYYGLALKKDRTVVGWAGNPTVPAGLANVIAIAAGGYHSLALKSDRTVIAWGNGGNGATTVPPGLSNVVAIAAGDYSSLALKDDGTLTGWGFIGAPTDLSNVVAIASGADHSLAVLQDGTVAAFGYNDYGDGDVPPGLSNVVAVSCGGYHCVALKRDGTVVAWGGGDTAPAGLSNVVQTCSGFTFELALIRNGPAIVRQPANRVIYSGMNALLSLGVVGGDDLTYQWRFNGTNIAGATQSMLSLINVQPGNSGGYSVLVSGSQQTLISSNANLTVITSGPIITSQTANQLVPPGVDLPLSVSVIGSWPLSFQWQLNGSNLLTGTNASLILTSVQDLDSGRYTVIASNAFGMATNSGIFVTVNDLASALNAPQLVWTNAGNVNWFCQTNTSHDGAASAQSTSLTSTSQSSRLLTTVTGPGTLNFWCMESTVWGEEFLGFWIDGIQQFYLPIRTTGWQQKRFYIGEGQHALEWSFYTPFYADSRDSAWVDEVYYLPGPTPATIGSAPTSVTNSAGETAAFNVTAFGTPDLKYQWQFAGSDIPGATNTTLSITNVQAGKAGTYSVIVSNNYGTAVSNATLTVNAAAPVVTTQPLGGRFILGSQKTFLVAAKGSEPMSYQWQLNGNDISDATNAALVFSNLQQTNSGIYRAVVSNTLGITYSSNAALGVAGSLVYVWGDFRYGQTNVSLAANNALAVGIGRMHGIALVGDGTVVPWGANTYGQSNAPSSLTNVVAVAVGAYHNLALKADGTVIAWGAGTNTTGTAPIYGQSKVPVTVSNVAAISAGQYHSLALKRDGTVVAWGYNASGQANVPAGLSNVISIAAGGAHNLASRQDGTVVAWGAGTTYSGGNNLGQSIVPVNLTNVVSVAAGLYHSMALTANGQVVAWGYNGYGQTNVPINLSNVVSIAAGDYHCVALKRDGTLALWGAGTTTSFEPRFGQAIVPATLSNFVAIAGGGYNSAAIVNDGTPFFCAHPVNRTIYSAGTAVFGVKVASVIPVSYQWNFNNTNIPGAATDTLVLTNAPLSAAGFYQCIVSNAVGVAASKTGNLIVLRSTPRIDVSAGSLNLSSTGFSFQLADLSGHGAIIVYVSTNLVDWSPIVSNVPVVGKLRIIDANATTQGSRFYRILEQ